MGQVIYLDRVPVKVGAVAVLLSTHVSMGSGAVIQQGLEGMCVWDEGGSEVIIAFSQDVPNGGFLTDRKQAWVPRVCLDCI